MREQSTTPWEFPYFPCVRNVNSQILLDYFDNLITHTGYCHEDHSKKLGPECLQNTMDEIMSGKTVDEKCAKFIDGLVIKRQSEIMQQGYSFDQESKSWTKKGYLDILMNIEDYYQQNLKNPKTTYESE